MTPHDREAQLRAVLDSVSHAIIATDLHGIIRTFNATAAHWLGYTADEVVGRHTLALFHDAEEIHRRALELSAQLGEVISPGLEVFTACVQRGFLDEREWMCIRKDGSRFPILLSITGVYDEAGQLTGYVGVAGDLTGRKQAERRVSAGHAAARVLAEAASLTEAVPVLLYTLCSDLQWDFGAYWVVHDGLDLIAGSEVWHEHDAFTEFDTVTRQLAFPPGVDLPGRVWQQGKAIWVPDVTCESFFLRASLADQEGLHAGFAFPIRFRGKTLGVLEFFSRYVMPPDPDLLKVFDTVGTQIGQFLDRQQAIEKLAQSEERFRALVENSSDALALLDGDGHFVYASPANARVLGQGPVDLHGQSLFELVHGEDRATVRDRFGSCLAQTGARVEFECRVSGMPAALGGWRTIEGVFTNRADVPTVEAVVANYRDVTERKAVERLKSEFISTVSHELRTPLTSIRGSLGLMAGGATGSLPAQAARLVDIAHKNSERLVRLINDILDLEKIESGHLQFQLRPLEYRPLVEQVLEANRAYAEQFGVRLVLAEGGPRLLRVLADPDRLVQVLNNLLSNAAKFSPSGAEVSVRIVSSAPWVRLSVRDRGPGIPEAFQARVFQKFAQADSSDRRQRGGTGLGLNISKVIVEKLGGRISFDTAPDGTTFHVDLPVHREPSEDGPRGGAP